MTPNRTPDAPNTILPHLVFTQKKYQISRATDEGSSCVGTEAFVRPAEPEGGGARQPKSPFRQIPHGADRPYLYKSSYQQRRAEGAPPLLPLRGWAPQFPLYNAPRLAG